MSFAEHLEELRKRLMHSAILVAVLFGLGWFVFPHQLESFFMQPHFWAVDRLADRDPPILFERRLMVLSAMEQIMYRAKVAILSALIIGFPYMLHQIWSFIAAGLFKHERRAVMRFMPWSLSLGIAGMAFGYIILVPSMLEYLYSMPDQEMFVQAYRLESYYSLFLLLTLALAAIFQLPLIMLGLSVAGLTNSSFYRKYRRHWIVVAVIVAGVVTPSPDPVSQLLMAAPMLLLFEIGLLAIALTERRKKGRDAAAPT
jgi:sec-independent protein translocase protein TatC